MNSLEKRILRVLKGLALSDQTELSLLICDDEFIAGLNQQYRGKDGPTNVLAFAMSEGEHGEMNQHMLGDVVVSLPFARAEAEQNGLDPDQHFIRLIIHGILHLVGYDHIEDELEAQKMYDLTERLLDQSAA